MTIMYSTYRSSANVCDAPRLPIFYERQERRIELKLERRLEIVSKERSAWIMTCFISGTL